jgi:hypothetical protein
MDINSNWRDLVHAYLESSCARYHQKAADSVEGWEERFLATHAVDALRQEYILAAKTQLVRTGHAGPKESFQIVEQSELRILAEVPPYRSSENVTCPVPFMPIRIGLKKTDRAWVIESMFQACLSCNRTPIGPDSPVIPRTPGRCFLCRGNGRAHLGFKLRGFSIFKWYQPDSGPCPACQGKGNCPECVGEGMPGWERIVSIGGMKPVAGARNLD